MIHVLKFKTGAYIFKREPILATVLAIIPVEAFTVLNNFLQSIILQQRAPLKKIHIETWLFSSSFFWRGLQESEERM